MLRRLLSMIPVLLIALGASASAAQAQTATITSISPSTGLTAGGTQVTITGSGFSSVQQVMLGGSFPSFTVISDTQISFTTQSAPPGLYNILLFTPLGLGGFEYDAFNYVTVLPQSTVTSISPSTGPTIGGTQVTITGSGFTGATAVEFGAFSAGTFTVDSDTQITATTPDVGLPGLFDLEVTTPGGPGYLPSAFTFSDSPQQQPNNSQSASAAAAAAATAVTADVFSRTTSTISSNTRMTDRAIDRFIDDMNSGDAGIISRDAVSGPLGLQVTGLNVDADDDGGFLFSSMSYMDVANGWRRVGFAELSFQDTQGVGSTLSVNGRISQERYLTASTLYGYFLGAELHRSDIEGSLAGDQDSWGVLAGTYMVARAENGLIGSAYGALGFNRSDLNIGNGTTTVTDSYDSRSLMLGAKLSGDLDYSTYRLRPSLEANYLQTHIGTLGVTETTGGTASDLSVAIGTIRFIDIVATPEFVFEGNSLMEGHGAAEFTVAPRLTCERRDAATDTRNCGGGLALGVSSNSNDGTTTLNGGVSFDRIGGLDRRAIHLQVEMRF